MGYVGNQTTNAYTSVDKQTITGNGGTSYTLSHPVGNENEIEVFVNNVRQEPSVAYTVAGTALTMTGNVASTDDFYIIYQGKAVFTRRISESIDMGQWTIELDGTSLLFKYAGTAKVKIESDGHITSVDDVTAFGSV